MIKSINQSNQWLLMNRYNSSAATLCIMSHNTNYSTTAQTMLLDPAGPTTDIVLMQEVNVKDPRYAITHPECLLLLPSSTYHKVTRTAAYISCLNPHLRVTPRPDVSRDPDLQVLEVSTALIPSFYLLNIYNERDPQTKIYTIPCSLTHLPLPYHCMMTEDLNTHHPLWNSHAHRPAWAAKLVELMEDHQWQLVNVPDISTHHYRQGTRSSVLDLTLASPSMVREVSAWAIDDGIATGLDHEVICFQINSLHPDHTAPPNNTCLNWKKMDWDSFATELQYLTDITYPHWSHLQANPSASNLDEWAALL
jgi:hypothetical protein